VIDEQDVFLTPPPISDTLREINLLRKERDEAWLKIGRIRNEIDCRIQHGADSNGHLEAILKMIDKDE
jgi:hypothetical protein